MKDINFPKNLIIAGQFCHGQWDLSGNRNGIFSPYNLQKIGELITPSAQQIQAVISSAQSAFEKWRQTPLKNRTQILFNFRHILMRDLDKISPVIALESGKLISEAQAGLLKGIEVLEFALSLQNIEQGGKLEVSRGVYCEFRRKPLGIVASITPFNFPAMVPLWTIPIALVLGNTFIWKPSDKTPLTSVLLADALAEAGIPAGVFSVLQGNKETVDALIAHPQVKAISFVGSSKIAKLVYQNAAQNGKRVLALGGAKNHLFLLPDADPKLTHKGIADSFTGCAGQRCMAASVLLSIGDNQKHIDGIVAQVKKIKLAENMGALITAAQRDFLCQAIERAVKNGAKILVDGRDFKPPKEFSAGHWLGPTILDHVPATLEAATDELFGPILSIIRCENIDQAINIENKSFYGNAASVFTSQISLAEYILERASAGMLGINVGVPVPREPFSFAGINESKFGHGEITGMASLNFWTDLQKITSKWSDPSDQSEKNWMN